MIKLTIGILTYNRPDCFVKVIESVLVNINEHNRKKLEILIADNQPGNTQTKIIALQYQKDYPDLFKYCQHSNNIGYDANVDFLFREGKGEYVWPFCDDDAFNNGAIDYVLELLEKHPDLSVIGSDYEECKQNFEIVKPRIRGEIKQDAICINGEDFYIKGENLFGLTSSLIINRLDWIASFSEKYIGTKWIHYVMVFDILSKGKTSFVVSTKLVKFRMMDHGLWSFKFSMYLIGLERYKILELLPSLGYSENFYRSLINEYYLGLFRCILLMMRDGIAWGNKKEVIKDLVVDFPLRIKTWLLYIPMLCVPQFFYVVMYRLYKKIH